MSGVAAPDRFVVRVPATSANLGPGFDCLGLALSLHNTIEVLAASRREAFSVEVSGEGSDLLPRGPENVTIRAMEVFAEGLGRQLPPFRLTMHNAIPLGRGMGSSAAAIVGGLVAAAVLLGMPVDPAALLPYALDLEGHPDNVAAALYGGLTLGVQCTSGTIIRRFDLPPSLHAVMLIPDQFSSTSESRAVLPSLVERAEAVFNASRCALLVGDLACGRLDALAVAMEDRLHQPQRAQSFPYLPDAIDAALHAGAHGAALSGAGSSVIALTTGEPERVAEAMAEVARRHRVTVTTRVLRPEPEGACRLE